MLSLLKYTLMKICSLWKILPTSNDTIFHYTVFELWAYVSVIARKISWTPESKLVQVMEVFQNNHFLSSDLLINIVYFYAKMQGKFFVQKCKARFCDAQFLQFWFFTIVCYHCDTRSHVNLLLFQICILERTFEKILLFGHQVIMHLKHCNYVEKIWSLVNYISWWLIGHITIWIRIISAKGGFPEYLLSAMWSFVHQCIFK